jgi:hypothetical protein
MTFMIVTYELQSPLHAAQLRALGEFANTYGLHRFRLDGRHLQFEYDASRLRESVVENILRRARIPVVGKLEPGLRGASPVAAPTPPAG